MKFKLFFFLLFLIPKISIAGSFFEPPEIHRETLSNGLVLFDLEDHELPTVELVVLVRDAGLVRDPKGKEGLAQLAMDGIRLGGTKTRSPEGVEEELESMGASLEMGANAEWSYASLKILRKDLEKGLELLFDLFRNPLFDPDQIDLIKRRATERILRGDEEPLERGLKEFAKQVYGKKSQWGRAPSPKSIKKIHREDLIEFHKRHIVPNRLVMAVSGDVTSVELGRSLKIRTADWPQVSVDLSPLPKVKKSFEGGQWFVASKGLKQATILVGHLGGRRDNPDKYALFLMNYILGGSGSLSSRLGEKIRTEGGKAYGVWSHYGMNVEEGLFYAVAQTEGSQAKEVTEEMMQIIQKMSQSPEISEEELARAKEAALTSFFFLYETSFSLVKDLAKFYLWGYPDNYLEVFQQEISSLTHEDLERVSRQYLYADGLKKVIVADKSVLKGLKPLGKFKVVKR
ncbi:MAG: insulinase family protein [Deltaproteobacteria bacterium]|nr:insulinase family protein [Deltaproteobacteria bacterium]